MRTCANIKADTNKGRAGDITEIVHVPFTNQRSNTKIKYNFYTISPNILFWYRYSVCKIDTMNITEQWILNSITKFIQITSNSLFVTNPRRLVVSYYYMLFSIRSGISFIPFFNFQPSPYLSSYQRLMETTPYKFLSFPL